MAETGRAGQPQDGRPRILVGIVAIALLLLGWLAAPALLLIFAGILFAVALEGLTSGLGRLIGLSHRIRLAITIAVLAALLVGGLAWGGTTLAYQFGQLFDALDEQVSSLVTWAEEQGLGRGDLQLQGMLPNMSQMAGGATNAFFALFGAAGNMLVVLFLGIFFAAEPEIYARATVSLVPPANRARVGEVLDETGASLRGWLVGQSISMAVIFLVTWPMLALVGVGYPFLLGLQAGLLVFIPTLGPVLAGFVIVLSGLAQGPATGLWCLAIYVFIQLLESNILTPLVQKRAVRLPPAFTLAFQLVMGALFGLLGVALAVPLAAAGKVLVEELYVKDMLGGAWKTAD